MLRILTVLFAAAIGLAGCGAPTTQFGTDGEPLPKLYRISPRDTAKVQFRMLDSVNALRGAAGLFALAFDSNLNAAAATHAQDMALQNRPWHFGSDGSSPIDRVARVGFDGRLIGENISETFETELETLAAWMEREDTRRVILSPDAERMGFAWYQEESGKIWWVMVSGSGASQTILPTPSF